MYILPISNKMFTSNTNIFFFMSQLKIYTKRKIASKKQTLEHKCILPNSCKTVRRWQRSIRLGRGDHCVGDWNSRWNPVLELSNYCQASRLMKRRGSMAVSNSHLTISDNDCDAPAFQQYNNTCIYNWLINHCLVNECCQLTFACNLF